MRNEVQKLELLAKAIHVFCDEDKRYGWNEWQEIIVDTGLGIDRRTAESYFRLAKIRRLISTTAARRWCKGEEVARYLHRTEEGGS